MQNATPAANRPSIPSIIGGVNYPESPISIRETVALLVPASSAIRPPAEWSELSCCVCASPVTSELWVRFIDHREQAALPAGVCSRSGCFRLVVSLMEVWTSAEQLRQCTLGPVRSEPVVQAKPWRAGW